MSKKEKSVVIIGGGLSGLTAAEQILKIYPNIEVTVLQAMDQVGGRTKSVNINGAIYDLGAQWIGPTQKFAKQLAIRSSNELIQQYNTGKKILQFKKQKQQYNSDIPKGVGIIPLIQMQLIMWKIDRMARKVPRENPQLCQHAHVWDSMTVHSWIMENVWFQKIRKLFQISVRAIIGCETNEISFLFFLWYIHQNSGLNNLITIDNGLQQKKMKYGTQYLSFYLKQQIQNLNGKVLLKKFVTKIIQDENGCQIFTKDGEKYSSDYIIFAGPPPAASKIQFTPQLSRQRRFIINRYVMGAYSKMVLLYKRPYWREKGYSGEILSDCQNSPVFMAYDDTRIKQNGESQSGMVVFFAAGIDEQWTHDKDKCMKVVTEKLSSYFGFPELLSPVAYELKVWNEQQSIGGAPTAFLPPGVLTKIQNLQFAEGRIHWAGTELANVSQGYMDGAIQSGIRVAKEIKDRLETTNNTQEWIEYKKQPSSSWYKNIATATKKYFDWW